MQVKYYVDHRVGPLDFCRFAKRISIAAFRDIGTKPIHSDICFAFILGCGHSGTTLLASRLGLSSDINLIPRETYAYMPYRSLKKTRRESLTWITESKISRKHVILEKTPKHVHCWRRILRLHPSAKFIGITRDPLDNIASLYSRLHDIDLSIERYILDNEALWVLTKQQSCLTIRYEDLTEYPRDTLAKVLTWLGCKWDDKILECSLTPYGQNTSNLPNQKIRFAQVSQPVIPRKGRYKEILTTAQVDVVLNRIHHISRRLGYYHMANVGSL